MNRNRRRGYMLGEMIVTCALLSLAATLAASMTIRLFQTGHSMRVDEREGLKIDAAIAQLRRDIEPSVVSSVKDGVLTTETATWKVRDDMLVRDDRLNQGGNAERTFGPLAGPIQWSSDTGAMTLQIGRARWTFAPLNRTGAGQ